MSWIEIDNDISLEYLWSLSSLNCFRNLRGYKLEKEGVIKSHISQILLVLRFDCWLGCKIPGRCPSFFFPFVVKKSRHTCVLSLFRIIFFFVVISSYIYFFKEESMACLFHHKNLQVAKDNCDLRFTIFVWVVNLKIHLHPTYDSLAVGPETFHSSFDDD